VPQHLNFKKGKQSEKTFSLSHYLIEIGQQQIKRRNQYYCFRPFLKKKKKIAPHKIRNPTRKIRKIAPQNKEAYQILAGFIHATFAISSRN
jgi:hypothetical protein